MQYLAILFAFPLHDSSLSIPLMPKDFVSAVSPPPDPFIRDPDNVPSLFIELKVPPFNGRPKPSSP